jgi:hypothetical protein
VKHFTLLPEHVMLLRRVYVDWNDCEYGAPCVDAKRPYGTSSVALDIAEILGWEPEEDADEDGLILSREQTERAQELHKGTRVALQVILRTGSFEPGEFVADNYDQNWRRLA